MEFILIVALLCSVSIDQKYFYIPIAIGALASLCFYYAVKETSKVLLELKNNTYKQYEQRNKIYIEILEYTKISSKENINRIDALEKKLIRALKDIEKNNTDLNNKISDLILQIKKEISSQYVESKQLYKEFNMFTDNYNKSNKSNTKSLCNEIKQSAIRIKDEITSKSNEAIGTLTSNNKDIVKQLSNDIKEESNELIETINNKADENIRILSSSLRMLIDNVKHANMKLDNNEESICNSIKKSSDNILAGNIKSINDFKNEIMQLLESNNSSLFAIYSKLINKEMDSVDETNFTTELADESFLGMESLTLKEPNGVITEYSKEDSHGIDYFVNDKIIRHEDVNGNVTEYEYENDNIKQAITKKEGKIVRICSYIDGVLDEIKSIEE